MFTSLHIITSCQAVSFLDFFEQVFFFLTTLTFSQFGSHLFPRSLKPLHSSLLRHFDLMEQSDDRSQVLDGEHITVAESTEAKVRSLCMNA